MYPFKPFTRSVSTLDPLLLRLGVESQTLKAHSQIMEENLVQNESVEEEEEEYVLLNLDEVRGQVDIPPNAPYVLSGLDTLNPILVIGDSLKLRSFMFASGLNMLLSKCYQSNGYREYEETIGTCLVFSEGQATPVVHEETGPSEANLFSGTFIIDPNQAPAKEVKPIASLQKILKFRLLHEGDVQDATSEPVDI
ncbi:hypothetical protein CK203_031424 [Vitis vinifera]|uniref:Transcription factor TFIIIC triple barrel domain-containing protein n=1 Tax=Vitis vinifera TaxID=29760 RepID=A0A438I8P2_VITVI|nr:hypothetical protein CK203_031424 [Vitis vinifera]